MRDEIVDCCVKARVHNIIYRMLKNKIFKQEIGIAKKAKEQEEITVVVM